MRFHIRGENFTSTLCIFYRSAKCTWIPGNRSSKSTSAWIRDDVREDVFPARACICAGLSRAHHGLPGDTGTPSCCIHAFPCSVSISASFSLVKKADSGVRGMPYRSSFLRSTSKGISLIHICSDLAMELFPSTAASSASR